jgi:2-dehydro-3-deoxyphosphogalactonate aldolase
MNSMNSTFGWHNVDRKLIAILRGIKPEETADIVANLIGAGFQAIEIPLNSPDPFRSIKIAAQTAQRLLNGQCLIGAGTVLTEAEALRVKNCGGSLVVSPNANPAVIAASVAAGLTSMPGVFTATEAHNALAAGATALKFFPASILGADGIKAIKTILPSDTQVCAVGGIGPDDFAAYMAAGVGGFGMGSSLYKPGDSADTVKAKAEATVVAYDAALGR